MKEYENNTDEELIQRQRAGERELSDYLIDKYKGMVLKKAHAMFLIGGEQEDLIQEGMIGLFNAVRDYQPDKNASFATFAALCVERQQPHKSLPFMLEYLASKNICSLAFSLNRQANSLYFSSKITTP